MRLALRLAAAAVLGLALLPAAASANATVNRDLESGIIRIAGDGVDDDITVVRTSAVDTVSRVGGGLTTNGAVPEECVDPDLDGNDIQCTRGSSLSVDLGAGNDVFNAETVGAPISVAGAEGNDTLRTGGGPDVLAGGPDNDTLEGRGGVDDYFGEAGDDTIQAHDGAAERIACGAGSDAARNDFTDVIAECERGIDGDADNFSSNVDCNDANPNINPGAAEVFDNGVDENCDGRDNPNLDRDGDGFAQPSDCNDANAAIRPIAVEIRGNAVDENCDRRAEPFAQLAAIVTNQWVFTRQFSTLLSLVVRQAPRGARIVFSCRGRDCPFRRARRRTVRRNLQRVVLHRPFRGERLRPGTRLRVSVTAAETVGRTYTLTVQRGGPPTTRVVCRAPGESRGQTC